ncbi:PEP-CTERM sorting domain-containing protein [Sulfuriferula sp.]|uniref:PEP-CTERM sorting domain-containing protein n=1 Tax=Sulfuriferula sp. TaxID=2025307 RepID=UPI002730ADB7|nr:PEP-CTERM sorting domain-containing protein [Sulfuriferula sp.]MDP2025635.1 PEP-CTERM sorting domain-containing protein [Sulfuriferula sp.]
MKFAITKMTAGLILAGFATVASAVPTAITTMSITGGSFSMNGGPADSFIAGNINSAFDVVGAYGTANTGAPATGLFNFGFFGPVSAFTGPGLTAPFGGSSTAPGGLVPTGTAELGGALNIDMSAWTAFWNNNYFNQGNSNVVGTVNNLGNYTMSWNSTISGGPFNGSTGTWVMNGQLAVAAVPEASTYGMMLAGLGLVGFAVRRRKMA